jgi:DNA polymerase-3 subunit epsilon
LLNPSELNLPTSPGVYRFYNRNGALLYVGKSIHIDQRVRSHYQARHHDSKEAHLVANTTRVDWTLTAGDIGALLLENRQIKTLHPLYNRRLRRKRQFWTLQPLPVPGSERIEVILHILDAEQSEPELYGLFASKAAALKKLRALVRQFQLCERIVGLESGRGRCFGHQIGRCLGACCGNESVEQHNLRLYRALSSRQLKAWPWPHPLVIEEPSEIRPTHSDWHLIANWAYIGTASDPSELETLTKQEVPESFDSDAYFILQKALKTPGLPTYLWKDRRLSPLDATN